MSNWKGIWPKFAKTWSPGFFSPMVGKNLPFISRSAASRNAIPAFCQWCLLPDADERNMAVPTTDGKKQQDMGLASGIDEQ